MGTRRPEADVPVAGFAELPRGSRRCTLVSHPELGEEVAGVKRRLRLKLHGDRAAYEEACRIGGTAFRERRFKDALATYEAFMSEHPDAYRTEMEFRIHALQSYVTDHVEKLTSRT